MQICHDVKADRPEGEIFKIEVHMNSFVNNAFITDDELNILLTIVIEDSDH